MTTNTIQDNSKNIIPVVFESQKTDYNIVFDSIDNINEYIDLSIYSSICVITDDNLKQLHWLDRLTMTLQKSYFNKINNVIIPSGENHKNLKTLNLIWLEFEKLNVNKQSLVINLGGGVINDIGIMASSLWLGRIDFVQIPSSLWAMIDSSVDNKPKLNFGDVKNTIGISREPKIVIIHTELLITLPEKQLKLGLSLAVKNGLINDYNQWTQLQELSDSIDLESDSIFNQLQSKLDLTQLIRNSIQIKTDIVLQDPTQKDIGKTLDFGNSLSECFESIASESDQKLLRGESLSLGIIYESRISYLMGNLSYSDVYLIKTTLENFGLPVNVWDYDWANQNGFIEKIKELLTKNKNRQWNQINWSLLKTIGNCEYNQLIPDTITIEDILSN